MGYQLLGQQIVFYVNYWINRFTVSKVSYLMSQTASFKKLNHLLSQVVLLLL